MKVFKYIKKSDNSLIGYHLSIFCQCGTLEQAKRYECTDETVEKQKQIIQNNFNSVINATEENQSGKFINLFPIKDKYFNGLSQDDVEIQYEDVPDVEIIHKVHTIVNSDGITHI